MKKIFIGVDVSKETIDVSVIFPSLQSPTADLLYNENEFKEATQIYLNALKYKPSDYDLYYNLGMTYTMLNDFQRAKEYYENGKS